MIKYKNINYVTLTAMFMIITIHFFKTFQGDVSSDAHTIMLLFRGFALPAVTLYLTNTAFTSFYLKKGVNYRSLFLFIIIPTLIFTQVQHYLFGMDPAFYNFHEGFNNSWFGEMYVYMMLLIPLALNLDNKNKLTRNLMLVYAIVLTIGGYVYSVNVSNPTLSGLKIAMMFPYVGLTYFMYRIIEVFMNNMDKIEKSKITRPLILLIIIIGGVIEAIGYSGISHDIAIRSYFSPVTVTFALCVWLLIYSNDLSKFPDIRVVTRSSYFLFFTHWILIRFFENFYPSFVEANVWIAYLIVVVGAYISSTILFTIYSWFTTKLLKL